MPFNSDGNSITDNNIYYHGNYDNINNHYTNITGYSTQGQFIPTLGILIILLSSLGCALYNHTYSSRGVRYPIVIHKPVIKDLDKLLVDIKDIPMTDTCSICIEPFIGDPTIVLHCSHLFHQNCIIKWFKTELTCPLCRSSIKVN
jgi:hypothetical protein